MIENEKSKFVTVGEAMETSERIVAAFDGALVDLENRLVESFAGMVPDDALTLVRAEIREFRTVSMLKMKRRLSPAGLQRHLESKDTTTGAADGDEPNPIEEPDQ